MEIQFLGAAGEVTGSCYLLSVNGKCILVDCGIFQGSRSDEARNSEPFPFKAADVDAVVLTHSHLDHSGRLPVLVKAGFRGSIYTHRASRDLCRIMLKDAAYLNEKEAIWQNRKRQRKHLPLLEPLYTMTDVQTVMPLFSALQYGHKKKILPGVHVRLQDAGHILGSSIVEMWLEEGGVQRKLVFSGDLGHYGAPILCDPTSIADADLVIMESTYGDRRHRSWEATWQELEEVITNAQRGKGNILIPAFTVGRTQELLYAFNRNYTAWKLAQWDIFLDSPMAIEATDVYRRHMGLYDVDASSLSCNGDDPLRPANLHLSHTANQSMKINRVVSGAIIIAGSGMCSGGRIMHHLKHNAWRRGCHILIVGFQARGTVGRMLVDGATNIRLWGETIRVAAEVHTIGGFSAHADCDGLIKWYDQFVDRPPVALVHGEAEAIESLAARLEELNAADVFLPKPASKLDLVTMREIN